MTPDQHLEAIERESAALASAATTSLDAPLGHLDGWQVRDVVVHLGQIYAMVASKLEPEADGPEPVDAPSDRGALADWFKERRAAVLAAFDRVDPVAVVDRFVDEGPSAWWFRRMASETAVHRWDVDAAISGPADAAPIEGDLAADAIDEYLAVSLRTSASRPNRVYPDQTLHLHRTDGPGEWMLASDGQGGVLVTEEHGKGDAAVRGSSSQLLLWAWGRPADDVEVFGDAAVADAWRALAP